MSLHPSVAAVRAGVRRVLAELDPAAAQQPTVLVACSGGADSLALLSAAVFEGHKLDVRVIGVMGRGPHRIDVDVEIGALAPQIIMAVGGEGRDTAEPRAETAHESDAPAAARKGG